MLRAASSKSGSMLCMSIPPPPNAPPASSVAGSGSSIGLSGPGCASIYLLMASTSGVSTKAHCTRMGSPPLTKSMSPRPMSWLAPVWSRMVIESIRAIVRKAIRPGKFALILPVIIVVVGRCVAMTMWMPTARAFCAIRAMGFSISLPAVMMRSPNSSMMTTT